MYQDPNTVRSPKHVVKSVKVIYDSGPVEGSWSVAQLEWGERPAIGIRWNGDSNNNKGTPQARGNPVWFIVPEELGDAVLKAAREAKQMEHSALAEGYKMMAADRERENEAEEWSEGLIGDAY